MALPASDSFAYTDGNLVDKSANWTDLFTNKMQVVSGTAQAASGVEAGAFWNADTFNNDQYSKAKQNNTAYPGPMVRAAQAGNATADGYIALWDGAFVYLQKVINGSRSGITSFAAPAFSAGAYFELRASGTTLQAFYNGSQVGTDQTDSDLSSGSAGVYCIGGSGASLDDWEGGNLGGAATKARIFFARPARVVRRSF